LLIGSLAFPLLRSFESRVNYYSKWKYLWPGIVISSLFFIVWDIWFTHIGVWHFNPDYVLGYYLLNLPVEECLFFIIIPFCCVFIYEVLLYFFPNDVLKNYTKAITLVLALLLLMVGVFNYHRLYTLVTFSLLGGFILVLQYVVKVNYLGRFYLTWLVCLFPFVLVNGVLTAAPVLIYNSEQNLGIRLGTIPIEDIFYGMLNLLQVIMVYEYLKQNKDRK
jgi:lycopene cyclase domain-containing protein